MNQILLEAQARVCTGPHLSRPLGLKANDLLQPSLVLDIILQSLKGHLPLPERATMAQMGAFCAAMTIRRHFPLETRWSVLEEEAMAKFEPEFDQCAPAELQFLLNPNRGIHTLDSATAIVVESLKYILAGHHLPYNRAFNTCQSVLSDNVHPALKAAVIIGQRMNLESSDEMAAYLDSVYHEEKIQTVNLTDLTHFGLPFDGATRHFRPALFVAAVRSALGQQTVLHGVDFMPPKNGITEEQILNTLGGKTNHTLNQAKHLLEDPSIGFAYVSQREYAPKAYHLRYLRSEIKKRPPWSATEKIQRLFSAKRSNSMVIGYYHSGYEKKLLQLAEERGVTAALAIKGEEGSCQYAMRISKSSTSERNSINHSEGFRYIRGKRIDFSMDINPADYGFHYRTNPRSVQVTAEAFAEAGIAALSGQKGEIYDRLILNTGIINYLLGVYSTPQKSIKEAKIVIDNGDALRRLNRYLDQC